MNGVSDDQLCNEIDDLLSLESGLQAKVAAVRRARDERKKERIRRGVLTRTVSDHALVRYLERCKGFDMEAFRRELRRMADEASPSKDGECHLHPSGVGLILGQDGQIVTVLGRDQIKRWTAAVDTRAIDRRAQQIDSELPELMYSWTGKRS